MKENRQGAPFRKKAIFFIALITLVISFVFSFINDLLSSKDNFDIDVLNTQQHIEQKISSLETVLVSLAGLYQSTDELNSAELSSFSENLLSAYPYISSILHISNVAESEVAAFSDHMIESGIIAFAYKSFSPSPVNLPDWMAGKLVIDFIEPFNPLSATLIGYDATTEPSLFESISQATETNHVISTQGISSPGYSSRFYLILKPIYLGRYPPESIPDRRKMLRGLVGLKIDPQHFIENLKLDSPDLEIGISHLKNEKAIKVAESSQIRHKENGDWVNFESTKTLKIYGQVIRLSFKRGFCLEDINFTKLSFFSLIALVISFLLYSRYLLRADAKLQAELAEIALIEEGERFTHVIDNAFDVVITIDCQSNIMSWNQKAVSTFGYEKENVAGKNVWSMILNDQTRRIHGDDITRVISCDSPAFENYQNEVVGKHKAGHEFPMEISVTVAIIGEQKVFSIFARDITKRRSAEEKIRQLAYFDSLTHLPNRQSFIFQAEQAIKSAQRKKQQGAILFIDLDDFKRINDTLGHNIGDLLIQQVATRITDVVREVDIVTISYLEYFTENVARFGGDEFTVLLSEINNPEEAGLVAERIINNIEKSFLLTTHEVYVTPSIGIAIFPDHGADIHQLLKNADTAMYHAKESGKNNYQFYTRHMSAHVEEHLKIEALLRKALSKNELKLFYQPQISGITGKLVGAEALLRWENTEAGNISPDVFIPVAERTGMILDIGDWVIREACRQNKEWQQNGLSSVKIAVNLSGVQFMQKNLCQKIQDILDETGLQAEFLELEITESTVMQNIDETVNTLVTLKSLGLDIAIDDFGTGYSSLSYLKKFPLKSLKIDRSFVMDIPENEDDVKLTTAIIALAKSLNLKVVAEGVENCEQQQFLVELECDYLQGYLFSKPLPADDFEKLLRDH